MRTEMFQQILNDLNGSSADIEASALISTDGLMIASALPVGIDEDRVGAMSAALLSLGDRAGRELARGDIDRVLVQGEKGYVIIGFRSGFDGVSKTQCQTGLGVLGHQTRSRSVGKTHLIVAKALNDGKTTS